MKMNSAAIPSSDGDVTSGGDSPAASFFYVQEYNGFLPGDKVDSYDPDDLSDVSVPSDDEGRESILADISPGSLYERNLRNTEIAIAIDDWSEYLEFARKITMDERDHMGNRITNSFVNLSVFRTLVMYQTNILILIQC